MKLFYLKNQLLFTIDCQLFTVNVFFPTPAVKEQADCDTNNSVMCANCVRKLSNSNKESNPRTENWNAFNKHGLWTLESYFKPVDVWWDGNCLFRSCIHACGSTNIFGFHDHIQLRSELFERMTQALSRGPVNGSSAFEDLNRIYEAFKTTRGVSLIAYISKVNMDGKWGSEIETLFIS